MLQKTKAIILNTLKYSDSSLIVALYTEQYGRISVIVTTGHSKKSKFKPNTFHPMAILECEIDYRNKREVQRIKDLYPSPPLVSIATEFSKSSIAIFLAEILYRTLREEQQNAELFKFLETSIQILEHQDKNVSLFHLSFICQYIRFLGFQPQLNYSEITPHFDLLQGKFVYEQTNRYTISHKETIQPLLTLFSVSYTESAKLVISRTQKFEILETLILYLQLHLDKMGQIQSHTILKQVFDAD